MGERYREDWQNTLSGGEAQRIGFARLFFHSPKFALLDEVTSGVAQEAEENLFHQIQARNVTYLSIIHKKSLEKFHHKKLEVLGEGKWNVAKLSTSGDQLLL